MSLDRRAAARVGAAALLLVLAGCGADSTAGDAKDADARTGEQGLEKAADRTTCSEDASSVPTPYGAQFPDEWPFPPGTTVYDVEDRGDQGTIVTAVSTAPFREILDFLNDDVVARGFRVESGETEAHDAEAEWTGRGHHGRWAIRESAQCPGETVIQVLAAASAD
jgi:hypothetical protein